MFVGPFVPAVVCAYVCVFVFLCEAEEEFFYPCGTEIAMS